jgi:O-antigen/teichoic acid export membrane protein
MFARPIVHVVLGATWVEQTTPIVRMLAVYCVFVGLFSPISSLDVIRDRMDVGFTWNFVTMIVRVGALAWGQHHGVPAAVAAYAFASAVMWLLNGFVLSWLLRAGTWKFHFTWLQFVPVWILLVVCCYGCVRLAGEHSLVALLLIPIPGLIYMAAVHWFYPSTGKLLMRLIASERAKRMAGMFRLGESSDIPTGSGANIP